MENEHTDVCGRSGYGKSTYLKNQMLDEIIAGDRAVVFIDPHGHDAMDLADAMPRRFIKRTRIIDFSDPEYAVSFNPILHPEHALSGMKSIWIESWGPRMNNILRYVLLVLKENPTTTLGDIERFLTDAIYRTKLLQNVSNPAVQRFFRKDGVFSKYLAARDDPFTPIHNKIGEITASPIRHILCDRHPTLDIKKLIQDRAIIIVNLAVPTVGSEAAAIAGSLITTTIRGSLMELNSTHPTEATQPLVKLSLYADEFPVYGSSIYASMLSEMRKFGLKMVLSHQYLFQIDEKLQKAILANVAHKVLFNLHHDDALIYAKDYNRWTPGSETFQPSNFTDLDKWEAQVDGIKTPMPLFNPPSGKLLDVIAHSRRHHARKIPPPPLAPIALPKRKARPRLTVSEKPRRFGFSVD